MGADRSAGSKTLGAGLASDALLEAIVEMSDDAIFTCDPSGRVTSWGATAERLFGRAIVDVDDLLVDVLFPPHLSGQVLDVVATVLAGDRVRHFETEVVRPDGMPLPVSLSLRPLLNAGGSPLGVVVIARDVTEQRLAQAALAEMDARMEEGEALAHIGSWLWDRRTGAVQWSAEFHRIHGIDPREFDGTFESYLESIHPDDREHMRVAMLDSVASGRQLNGEYRVNRDGEQPPVVQVRAKPTFGSNGEVVGLRGIGQAVSGRPDSTTTSG
jgi:PAS domain S-box-containing protein